MHVPKSLLVAARKIYCGMSAPVFCSSGGDLFFNCSSMAASSCISGGIDSGVMDPGGIESGGMDSGGMDSGGMDSGGIESGGMDSGGVESGGMDSEVTLS